MILTLELRLLPSEKQAALLRSTMRAFNAAATHAAVVGFRAGVRSQPSIHNLTYYELRERFGLSSQMAVRAIGKAVEAFAQDKTRCPVFRPNGAMTYDQRLMSFKGVDKVSLLTLAGREIVPMIYGEYQRQRFDRLKGQCDVAERDGKFYLYASIEVPDGAPIEPTDFLGVDLGITNLATDSDGTVYIGATIERVRSRHHRNKKRLQRKGTRGAKKRLKALAGRESRFRRHHNHCISKQLVGTAKDTKRGLALENLTHIRTRTTVRRKQRDRHAGWAFRQLRSFVEYKAALAGVAVRLVDPRNTSRTCSRCGHCEKANRRSQGEFQCLHCGYSTNADFNAALNLSRLGRLVGPPQNCQLAQAS